MSKLFGTDGVRGVANLYPMDSITVLKLGKALAHIMRRGERKHRILIGKDTRISGYMLETALSSGICSMGVDVLLLGPLPTPGVAFMIRSMRADAGVMISASHNSYEDNGIKIFGPDGFKLDDEVEAEITELVNSEKLDGLAPSPDSIGKAYRVDDAVGRYIVYLKNCIDRKLVLDGLKIVVDSANGAAYKVAPSVFLELGAEVIQVGNTPNGKNINKNCGSLHPEVISKLVIEHGAHCGIAFDGDADRVLFSDENGEVLDGDSILALLALDFKSKGKLGKSQVVGTVMSNLGLEVGLKNHGITLHRTDVGDRYVLQRMLEDGLNLGGEQSGHIISLDYNTTGDGILTALLVLSILKKSKRSLSSFSKIIPRFPQELVNIKVKEKKPLVELLKVTESIDRAKVSLADKGRILVRYSGTENKIRVMVECEDAKLCSKVTSEVAEVIGEEIGVE